MSVERVTADRDAREAIIRLAVRDFAQLHLSEGVSSDRLTEEATLDDAAEATHHWTGINISAVRGGRAILLDEAQTIQIEHANDAS